MTEGISNEDDEQIRRANDLIVECMKVNKIKPIHGVYAMINVVAWQLKDEVAEKLISFFYEEANGKGPNV